MNTTDTIAKTETDPGSPGWLKKLFSQPDPDLPAPEVKWISALRQEAVRAIVAKGAMPPLVLNVEDCRAAYDRMRAFTQEPVDRYGTVDAGFRDPSGNGWKMIQGRG